MFLVINRQSDRNMCEEEFQVLTPLFNDIDSVLEVGCGRGGLTQFLSGICTNVTAIDISPLSVSVAKEKLRDRANVTICEMDAQNMGELSGTMFDTIVLCRTLHFLPDIPVFYKEATRLLRPGGKIVVISCPVFELSVDTAEIGALFSEFWNNTFHPQLENYWSGKTAENFTLYCDPERTEVNGPPGMTRFQRLSLKSETGIHLVDIAQRLSDFTVVQQFLQENGMEDLMKRIEQLQGKILRLHGLDPGDLLFEDVTLIKTVKYHVEIHSIE